MTVSKIRLPDNTEHDIRAKYLIQSTSSDAVSAEFSARTVTEDAIVTIQKIYGNTVVESNNLVSNSATAIQSKDAGDNVIGGCDLNIPTLTGKLNGAGSSVVIFPDGLKKISNTLFDDLTRSVANKRVGSIDISNATVGKRSAGVFQISNLPRKFASGNFNVISAPYATYTAEHSKTSNIDSLAAANDKSIFVNSGAATIFISDSDCPEVTDLKATGTLLYFEAATAEEYILDNALQLQYPVVAGGTEMVLPTSGTAPIKMDVIYGNAADAAATMSQNFISVDSMKEFLAALGTQMGGIWSMGYENGKHTFTFTSN